MTAEMGERIIICADFFADFWEARRLLLNALSTDDGRYFYVGRQPFGRLLDTCKRKRQRSTAPLPTDYLANRIRKMQEGT